VVGGLSPGTKYCFKLVAFNAQGSSPEVTTDCVTTPVLGR